MVDPLLAWYGMVHWYDSGIMAWHYNHGGMASTEWLNPWSVNRQCLLGIYVFHVFESNAHAYMETPLVIVVVGSLQYRGLANFMAMFTGPSLHLSLCSQNQPIPNLNVQHNHWLSSASPIIIEILSPYSHQFWARFWVWVPLITLVQAEGPTVQ